MAKRLYIELMECKQGFFRIFVSADKQLANR